MSGRFVTAIALAAIVSGLARAQAPQPSGAASSAGTDRRAAASAHFERGIEFFNEGRFDAALAELERAYDLSPAYPVLYNLARVHAELGHPVEAVRAFERYLAEGGEAIGAARRREVEQEIARQRARIGRLLVETNVPGSIVSVDGVDVATTPLTEPILLGAGEHTIGVRAPGHESVQRAVRIAGTVHERLFVELRPELAARGTLRISSTPIDARITIDGRPVGYTPLESTVPVPAGEYEVAAERPGYLRDVRRVRVDDQAEVEVHLRLQPDPAPAPDVVGELRVDLPDVAYVLRVDGEERASRGPLRLAVGRHRLEVEAVQRERWSGEVRVEPGQTVVVAPPLAWTPAARQARLESAATQRTVGVVLSIAGAVALAAALPVAIWNEDEIRRTDQALVELDTRRTTVCRGIMIDECDRIRAEIDRLAASQSDQNVVRAVAWSGVVLGAVLAAVGIPLWASAPSEEDVERAAHARLRPAPGGLVLDGRL